MALAVKNPPANAGDTGDTGLIPRLGIGKGQMLQHEGVSKFNQEQLGRENV